MIAWTWSDLFVQTITPLQAECSRPCSRPIVRSPDRAGVGGEFKWDIGVNVGLGRRSSEMTRWAGAGLNPADARPFLSAFALHRFVREPLELAREWSGKAHPTLRHDQACGVRSRRNPPLRACASAPKELASRVLMLERRRLQSQRSREPVPLALKFSERSKAYPHALSQLVGHHQLDRGRLEQRRTTRKQASNERHHVRQGRDQPPTAALPRAGTQISPRIWRVVRAIKSRLHGVDGVGPGIKGDEALAIRHPKSHVHHATGPENSRLNERIEALAADHFDETRQDVGGDRVLPRRSGMKD